MMRIADFTGLPLKVSIGHPSASLRHHGSTFLADWYSIAARASMIPTGSPRRILSLISSKKGSAEQGGGGQQPPVESFGVYIVLWREAVPHLGRSPTQLRSRRPVLQAQATTLPRTSSSKPTPCRHPPLCIRCGISGRLVLVQVGERSRACDCTR